MMKIAARSLHASDPSDNYSAIACWID